MRWYKRYPDAALNGMAELSLAERGAYNSILDLLYSREGVVPDDDVMVARMVRCHWREWRAIKKSLIEHGKVWIEKGFIQAKRVQETLKEASDFAQKQSKIASERWQDRENSNENNASVMPITTTTTTTTTVKERKKESCAVAIATRPTREKDFQEFWDAYPKRKGANPKAPARKLFDAAIKGGADPPAIIAGARQCAIADREKIGTEYIPQAVKWLRDRRWEDYCSTGPPDDALSDFERAERTRQRMQAELSGGPSCQRSKFQNGQSTAPLISETTIIAPLGTCN